MMKGGETIKKVAIIAALVMAMFAVPAIAQDASIGTGADILGNGIFETGGAAFKFPVHTDTNFDSIIVGNDYARAFGWSAGPYWNGQADAQNNLEVKKNQNVGACASCCPDCMACTDACVTVNVEHITVGDRTAQAVGFASAVNNVKIVTNQDSY
jgi:hypothetical protein